MTLKLSQEGHHGLFGSISGDLYVDIKIKPHDIFVRKENDVYSTIFIDIFQAILGDTINVSTIYGIVNLKIPEGTQTDTKFRLKNKGISYLQSSYKKGDHYVVVKVETLTNLTHKEKECLKQLKEMYYDKKKVNLDGFFNSNLI